MATVVHIPVSEYLRTSYKPDCDYVDGEVQERNLGTQPHGILQTLLAKWFDDRFDAYGWVGSTEQRLKVAEGRYRVPDVCALIDGAGEDVVTSPPLVCAEVLSPDDTLHTLQDRINDYLSMGVPNIWIFDPVKHDTWSVSGQGALQPFLETLLPVAGTDQALDLPALFLTLQNRLLRLRP